MSAAHSHENMVPAAAVKLAAGFVIGTLLLVTAVRFEWLPQTPSASELRTSAGVQPVAERLLRFADVNGAVVVTNARTGETVASFGQQGSGFIRGVMRGLARERRMHGHGPQAPFRLTRYADGQLSLIDMATGRIIELNGFGHTNVAAFNRLLEARP
jgi:putative photosynthetic complex assembly protein